MKKSIIIAIIGMLTHSLWSAEAPKKQKVYSIVKQFQELSWYEEQLKLWRNEVSFNPQNAEAWLNVYAATRMQKLLGGTKSKTDMDAVVEEVKKNIPNTFESHYIQYWNGNNEEKLEEHLFKAYELGPDRPELFDDFVTYYELKRDKVKTKEFCEKWFTSNDLSSGLMAFSYNMLMSCDENGILITFGDNDTYPAIVLQQAKAVRTDVTVLNAYLLLNKSYRDIYFRELGIPIMNEATPDVKLICTHLQTHSNRPFYYASTVDPDFYASIKENVYAVGLAYKYSKDGFDNVAVIRKNYEKNFLLDYLKINLVSDISQGVVDNINANYLVPFITLYNHYSETDEKEALKNLNDYIDIIAKRSGKSEEVNAVIHNHADHVVSFVFHDPREAMFGMVKINEKLYASQFETGNGMYNKFLEDLLKQKRYNDLMVAKAEKINWESLLLPVYKNLGFEEYFKHGKPDADKFPISNISYEAAVLYCDWLTTIYNNLEHKKKQFKKVKFRLPTEKEWEDLARCGMSKTTKYPWGYLSESAKNYRKDTITNATGCYLANIQSNKEVIPNPAVCPSHDGGVFPVNYDSYHPTDYGMYCMIGNVAEMVQEKGIAKGGGWNTLAEDAQISKQQNYSGPDPNIGFRVIMEVIEK